MARQVSEKKLRAALAAHQLAQHSGLMSYELVCSCGARSTRFLLRSPKAAAHAAAWTMQHSAAVVADLLRRPS